MKFFAVFAAVLALAAGSYNPVSTWTLPEIEAALQDPATDPALIPYLINGLNTIVANLHAGIGGHSVVISMPVETTVTMDELMAAIHDPSTSLAVMPYLEEALENLMAAMTNGQEEDSIVLSIPAMNVNVWTLNELSDALQNPETDPELMVYLEHAMNELMSQLFEGQSANSIMVVTPPGVMTTVPEPGSPIIPVPITEAEPIELETPVKPETPVNPTPAASAPLVQLIVNINTNQQQQDVALESPALVGEDFVTVERPVPVDAAGQGPILAIHP